MTPEKRRNIIEMQIVLVAADFHGTSADPPRVELLTTNLTMFKQLAKEPLGIFVTVLFPLNWPLSLKQLLSIVYAWTCNIVKLT